MGWNGAAGSMHGGSLPGCGGAQINVLGSVPYPFGAFFPGAVSDVWKTVAKPRFSGQPHDYARFEVEWNEIERVYRQVYPLWNDTAMLHEFKACLDEATQIRLRARLREKPELTLVDFKRELRQEFGIDAQRQNRRDWESVTLSLSGPPGKELTMADWRRFEASFKLFRASVPERSASEEWRMIFSKLPEKIQELVIREQAKMRSKRPWVRLTVPGQPAFSTDVPHRLPLHLYFSPFSVRFEPIALFCLFLSGFSLREPDKFFSLHLSLLISHVCVNNQGKRQKQRIDSTPRKGIF